MAPRVIVRDLAITERPVKFARPFRFGAATVEAVSEAFVHAEIELDGGRRSRGATAELIAPKWFDKNPALTLDETAEQLRNSLAAARATYLERASADSAFALHAACHRPLIEAGAVQGLPPLAAAYGGAMIDKAILDALLRALGMDVFTGLADNIMGLDTRLTPDLDAAAVDDFLSSRNRPATVFVRHTVGLLDPIDALVSQARRQGLRYFKIKFCGNPDADRARLIEITQALDDVSSDYRITVDANEQYRDMHALRALVDALLHDDACESACQRLVYIEQPLPREDTWKAPLGDAGRSFAFIIDEADDGYDAFPKAVALGYRGVSSKSCKGIYKSLLNGARAAHWSSRGMRAFIAAEDLTCQAGLAVQQDTALAAIHGIAHCERNGHHYADGFAAAHPCEAEAFLLAHSDLYERADGQIRIRVTDGRMAVGSILGAPGFASAVDPAMINLKCSESAPTKEFAS